jgi:glutathione reductase (NADPH)
MNFDFDLFVIGGGSAGTRCARIAAGLGARVGVAEDRHWGGTCVNIGCVPKKLMVMASEYGAAAQDSRGFGWEVQAGRHDWGALIAAKDVEINRLQGIYRRMLDGAGAKVFDARATFTDAHTLDVGGARVTADRIVIATGGHPSRPAFPGAQHVIVSDDAFYLPDLPPHVTLVGGGYIAVEFAGIFAGLGAKVDMIMRQDLPLRGFDHDLRTALAESLAGQGINLLSGRRIARVETDGPAKIVTLTDGATIETDLVFAALGRSANTAGLNLNAAGVATTATGAVIVDAEQASSAKHIFAIGDVTDQLNLTPVAIAEDGAADIYVSRFTPMRHTLSGRARKTMMKLVVDQKTQHVVGAHMLGEDAPEIIQGISIAMNAGATKADFDRTVGIHPTAAEEFVTMRTRTRVAEARVAAE